MSEIEDALDAITVTAKSPDGRIEGRMKSLRNVAFRFLFDSYEQHYRYQDGEVLAHQLGRGAVLLAAAYLKARREIMRAHGFERLSTANPPNSSRHREYLERGAKLTARGASPDREIRVMTMGMVDFTVKIASQVPYQYDQTAFLQLANSAMKDLQQDYRRAHRELRHELYLKYKDRER